MCVQCRDILVRRASVFDAVQTCGTVAFDKTGTLTTGVMAATSMQGLQHQAQHLQQSSGLQNNAGASLPPHSDSLFVFLDACLVQSWHMGLGTLGSLYNYIRDHVEAIGVPCVGGRGAKVVIHTYQVRGDRQSVS